MPLTDTLATSLLSRAVIPVLMPAPSVKVALPSPFLRLRSWADNPWSGHHPVQLFSSGSRSCSGRLKITVCRGVGYHDARTARCRSTVDGCCRSGVIGYGLYGIHRFVTVEDGDVKRFTVFSSFCVGNALPVALVLTPLPVRRSSSCAVFPCGMGSVIPFLHCRIRLV